MNHSRCPSAAISATAHPSSGSNRNPIRRSRVIQLDQIDAAQWGEIAQIALLFGTRNIQDGEWRTRQRRELGHLRAAEIEREPTVLTHGEAILERLFGRDGQVLESRKP